MRYIVAGYYTVNTDYEEEVQHLIKSLQAFNLPMDIIGVPTQGSWQENCQYKAYFIKQMLIRHYPKDILYLDSDAIVRQYPILFDHVDFDIGAVYRLNVELTGSTLYFANNSKVFEVVERWISCCLQNPQTWDNRLLQYILKEEVGDLNLVVRELPHTYGQIFDLMKDAGDPVIEQFQASRRFKRKINELGRNT